MDTVPPPDRLTDAERRQLAEAEQAGGSFLVLRDGDGVQRIVRLSPRRAHYTIGRRAEADIALPWDPEVSRLHAQLERLAGEWTISDDGLSQNGTLVNELLVERRRRLVDGDLIRVGRTALTFRSPGSEAAGATMLPGELSVATALSEQQHRVIRELCRPLMADGENVAPTDDATIAAALQIPLETVDRELQALIRALGFGTLDPAEARHELALGAIRHGLVRPEDFQS